MAIFFFSYPSLFLPFELIIFDRGGTGRDLDKPQSKMYEPNIKIKQISIMLFYFSTFNTRCKFLKILMDFFPNFLPRFARLGSCELFASVFLTSRYRLCSRGGSSQSSDWACLVSQVFMISALNFQNFQSLARYLAQKFSLGLNNKKKPTRKIRLEPRFGSFHP